jgi:anti-sigma factor RsiW
MRESYLRPLLYLHRFELPCRLGSDATMTANFEDHTYSRLPGSEDSPLNRPVEPHSPRASMKVSAEQFELLSAYLDGEILPTERRQVEYWLDHDETFQHTYRRMMRLRETMKALPVPIQEAARADDITDQVLARVGGRSRRTLTVWGGMGIAIAAGCVAVLSSVLSGRSPLPEMAATHSTDFQRPLERAETLMQQASQLVEHAASGSLLAPDPDSLVIALDKPIVEIPSDSLIQLNGPNTSN